MTLLMHRSAGAFALAILVAAVAVLLNGDGASAHYYEPCGGGQPESVAANTASNINGNYGIGIGADCKIGGGDDDVNMYNSGGLITFTPPEWGVAKDADIPDGTQVGTFSSIARLGLLNNPCNNTLPVNFDLLDATVNSSKAIDALPPGTPNRLVNLTEDDNGDGIPDGADSWPSYLTVLAERNSWDLSKVAARFVGFNTTSVSGTAVVLNFLVFEPGSFLSNLLPNGIDPRLGYPAVTVLQDPTAIASKADPVNDFCAPLETSSSLFGTAGGKDFRKNPADGVYNFVVFTTSALDADEDGIENGLDPCPNTADSDFNPRGDKVQPGDRDGDGIPNSCDPFPDAASLGTAGNGISLADEDGDGWQNRGDNCAIVSNEDQADVDLDGLGDACDPDPAERTGHFHLMCLVTTVTIGAGGAAPPDPQTMTPCNPEATQQTPTPGPGVTATATPFGQTPGPTRTGGVQPGGTNVDTGIGSLSPSPGNVSAWAVVITVLGAVGFAGGLGLAASRRFRR